VRLFCESPICNLSIGSVPRFWVVARMPTGLPSSQTWVELAAPATCTWSSSECHAFEVTIVVLVTVFLDPGPGLS
jgi:hypothetical protein